LPDTSFHLEFFASSTYNADGSGEAEDFLGSMEVTTDATGQVVFTVPFTAPAGLPIITATATDPQGNTSEVSALRPVNLETPPPSLRIVPNQALVFSAGSGKGFSIQEPDAGPLNPVWSLTVSVSAGTLALPSTAGLTGSGDGTGSLSYRGPLTAVDAALEGLTYTPPAGPHVFATIAVDAQSYGAPPLQTQVVITDGVFVVNTTADSGVGSLRYAILDSNAATGVANTIDFAIPGSGVQTIAPLSPLPAITHAVLIDGESQASYSGTPLIELGGGQAGDTAGLTISGADVTVQDVGDGSFAFGTGGPLNVLTLPSSPLGEAQGGADFYQIDTAIGEELSAVVHANGELTTRLSLTDSQGHVLMTSDGRSAEDGDNLIQLYIPAGSYTVDVQDRGGMGTYTLTAALVPANRPLQPMPLVPPGGEYAAWPGSRRRRFQWRRPRRPGH
jgi:hypothetical protein